MLYLCCAILKNTVWGMSSDDLFKILKADGWELERTKGSHHIFKHPEKKE